MSAAKIGLATLLKRGATTIPEIKTITISNDRDSLDVTNMDSTAPWREFIAGLVNAKVTFGGNFLSGTANQLLITTDLFSSAGTKTTWSITFPAGTIWSFTAFVTSFSPTASDPGAVLNMTGSLQIDGAITIT